MSNTLKGVIESELHKLDKTVNDKFVALPIVQFPVIDYFKNLTSRLINPNPEEYQRAYVADNPWAAQLMASLFSFLTTHPIIVPPLVLRVKVDAGKWLYEVIDGCQRSISLRLFLMGELRLPKMPPVTCNGVTADVSGKTWLEIKSEHDELTECFEQSVLYANVYFNITDEFASKIFIKLNDNNDLTPAEKRNAIRSAITATIRGIARLDDTQHPLFKTEDRESMKLKYFKKDTSHKRMDVDKMLAELAALLLNNGADVGNKALRTLYEDPDHKEVYNPDMMVRYLDRVYGVVKEIGVLPSNISLRILRNYVLLIHLIRKFKNITIKNEREFFELYVRGDIELRKLTPELKAKRIKQTGYTATVSKMPNAPYKLAMEDMLNYMQKSTNNFNDGTSCINSDPKRTFTKNEVTEMALKQNKICLYCKETMRYDDMVGAHRIAWSQGGRTTLENGFASHSACNKRAGARDYVAA